MNDKVGQKGGGGLSKARRLYATVKFDIISLTARSRGSIPVNKQGATCYIATGADLRLFVLSTYLFFLVARWHDLQGAGKAGCARLDTTSNRAGMTHDRT